MKTNAIDIRGLVKRFPAFTLGPIDLQVPAGAIYSLIGPNGCGKSTTMDLLFGMGCPDAGEMRVLGLDAQRDEVAMKLQTTYLSPDTNFSSWGKIGLLLDFVRPMYPHWDSALCEKLLGELKLKRSDRIASLSFGSRTKLALLLTLCPRPKLLLLDEPTTGLDPEARTILFREMLHHVENEEHAVLISSHELASLERFADHVGMLHDGKMLLEGRVDAILERHVLTEFAGTPPTKAPPGFHLKSSDQGRFHAMVDREQLSPAVAQAYGLQALAETPLTLEEIFMNLNR